VKNRPIALLCLTVAAALLLPALASAQTFNNRWRTFKVGPNPSAIAAADLNDNGYPDIVTADRGVLGDPREERPANDELSVLLAEGSLNYVRHHPSLKTGFGPYAIVIANIDALKWPDIIVANFHDVRRRNVSLFLNLKQEGIFKPVEFTVPEDTLSYVRQRDGDDTPLFTVPGLTSLVVSDFDGDGFRDLLATGWSSDVLVLMRGEAENLFGEPQFIEAPGAPRAVKLGDFDNDGRLDAVVAMYATNELAFFKGDGRANFTEVARIPSRGRLPVALAVADINGDGNLDVVVAHSYTDDSLVIFYGNGRMGFSISQEIMLGSDRGVLEHEIRDVVAADFTGNGRTDIAAACFASGEVRLFANVSSDDARSQQFRNETYSIDGGKPRALCVADFDRNGKLDLGVALWGLDAVGLLINQR